MASRRTRFAARLPAEVPVSPTQPDELILVEERRRLVEGQLGSLSEKLRDVVVLRYAGELTLEEIARVLELPLGTVKSRLFAAMSALSAAVKKDAL
jgi:RNA polymerase sigma-70 factor (ECF subfamily)